MGRTAYTPEQKANALKMLTEFGATVPKVSKALDIPEVTLQSWKKQAREQANPQQQGNGEKKPVSFKDQLAAAQAELEQTKAKLFLTKLRSRFLVRYATTDDESERKDIEIEYLRECLAAYQIKVRALTDQEEEEEEKGTGESDAAEPAE